MRYLAPNDTHQITVPVIVGAEYTFPTGDAQLSVRESGVTQNSTIPLVEATEIVFDLMTPNALAGELKIINVSLRAPTQVGALNYREVFGVVDVLDIPTDCNQVRTLLGVTSDELPDDSINLESQYVEVYKWLINDFHILRQNDAYLTKKFADIVAVIAAIVAAPTLIIRLDKSRKTENGQFQRLIDPKYFQDFLLNLDKKLADLKSDLEDFLEIPAEATYATLEFVNVKQWSINS